MSVESWAGPWGQAIIVPNEASRDALPVALRRVCVVLGKSAPGDGGGGTYLYHSDAWWALPAQAVGSGSAPSGQVLTADGSGGAAFAVVPGMSLIDEQTADTTSAGVIADFVSIPTAFRHLRLVLSGRGKSAGIVSVYMRFNGDAGANYDVVFNGLETSGGTAPNSHLESSGYFLLEVLNQYGGQVVLDFPYYRARPQTSGANRVGVQGTGVYMTNASPYVISYRFVGGWRNSSALTEIALTVPGSGGFETICSLYGVN